MNKQLSLFSESTTNLDTLIEWSFSVFDLLDSEQEYQLAFSGGKDSHVLLGVYLAWCKSRGKQLNIKVVFSDTFLESPQLLELVDNVKQLCDRLSIPFLKVQPPLHKNFWVLLVGLGYPVPNHKNRWCTQHLKISPMSKLGAIPIAGSHLGESTKRDARIHSCGSSECGIDKIENKIEALARWRNCNIWDFLILRSDGILYQGVSEKLLSLYDITENQNGSLRMGCAVCPVVSRNTIAKQVKDVIIPCFALAVRDLIDSLRIAPRINSQRTGKAGAILVDARIEFWRELQPYILQLRSYDWLSVEVEQLVNELLDKRSYPPTYKQEWIIEQEPLAKPWTPKK